MERQRKKWQVSTWPFVVSSSSSLPETPNTLTRVQTQGKDGSVMSLQKHSHQQQSW